MAVKGSLQGPAGSPQIFLSARKPQSANSVCFPRDHPLEQRGGVFQSVASSADGDRWRRRLKAQELDWMPRSRKPLFSAANFVDPQAPTSYIDVLNTLRTRHPSSQQQKLMREEHERHENILEQRARNFVDGIMQFISSEKEYYMFIIIACKENTNMIMELGFISCYNRDDILDGLERIEDDIAKERFQWRENKDVRSNIVEALVERVGEPVELVLLALRNWGFVVPLLFRHSDWILLGELVLSKVKLLERDVSRLRSCKNKIDSTLLITFPLCSADGCVDRSSNDGSHLLQNAVINFGNIIIGDIAIDISTLEREISYWTTFRFLTPNDRVRESLSLLDKHVSDLSKLATIRRDPLACYGIQKQDTCQRFLAVYSIVQQLLKAATDFAKNTSFNHKKVQSFPSFRYIDTGLSKTHTVKVNDKDETEKATQEFRSRSDEVMKRLVDWLAKHQTVENPLKFSQFEFK